MKRIILIVLLLLVATILLAADPVAYLMQGKGKVQIQREKKEIKFKNGELLYNNDEVRTGSESFAAVKYMDGAATVKVFPNSILKVTAEKLDKQLRKNVLMQQGSLFSQVSKRIKGTYQVETPTTVASVKGTGFLVRITSDKKTIIIVLEGEVIVLNKISGKSIIVSAGSTATSDANGDLSVQDTNEGEITDSEMQEIEDTIQDAQKTLKVQVTDKEGNIKYIEISY